jgi:hypothetical protein
MVTDPTAMVYPVMVMVYPVVMVMAPGCRPVPSSPASSPSRHLKIWKLFL